ncbi:MAG: hypothetical protein ACYTF0_07655, partial [Planctomycetota bacterium]
MSDSAQPRAALIVALRKVDQCDLLTQVAVDEAFARCASASDDGLAVLGARGRVFFEPYFAGETFAAEQVAQLRALADALEQPRPWTLPGPFAVGPVTPKVDTDRLGIPDAMKVAEMAAAAARLDGQVGDLESAVVGGQAEANRDQILGIVDAIKGDACALGLFQVEGLVATLEEHLSVGPLNEERVDALLMTADWLRSFAQHLLGRGEEPPPLYRLLAELSVGLDQGDFAPSSTSLQIPLSLEAADGKMVETTAKHEAPFEVAFASSDVFAIAGSASDPVVEGVDVTAETVPVP